ncbi:MAG TPA: hypothetical protein VLA03_07765, partial [Draconibacterium sp.]|nr:hypothetical protein [Draconibacterium sp.]
MTDTTVNSLKRDLINIDNIYIKFIQLEVYTTNFYKDPDLDLDLHYGLNLHNEFMMGNTDIFAAYGFYLRKSEYYTSRA